MIRPIFASMLLAGALVASGASAAQDAAPAPVPVYCATFTCFQFRVPAQGKDAQTRAAFATDVINKYLGGAVGKVATKADGKNVRLLLNNELVAVVTPADAAAEKQKSAAVVAAKWSRLLAQAFNASKARP